MQQTVNVDYEEDVDGIRFNWNRWPSSMADHERIVLHLSCLYTPLKEPQDSRYYYELQKIPTTCCRSTCKAVLNPFCCPDLLSAQKCWICNFCNQRNQLPQEYQNITDHRYIPEFLRNTVDYIQSNQALPHPPVFVYVVDLSIDEEGFASLRASIISSLALLPPNALVTIITFDHIVNLWELDPTSTKISKSFAFDGQKDYSPKHLQGLIGLSPAGQPSLASAQPDRPTMFMNGHPQAAPNNMRLPAPFQPTGNPGASNMNSHQPYAPKFMNPTEHTAIKQRKFISPASELKAVVSNIFDQVSSNTWSTASGHRPLRAVGAALSIAINVLELTYPQSAARIMLFVGGPCTVGPGMVVDDLLKNTIRTHHDIERDNAKYMKKACEYYNNLAARSARNGHTIDIFSCALDQTGLHEMKSCTNMTNGLMVMGEAFHSNLFRSSFQRIFTKDKKNNLRMAFNAIMDVKTSRELKVCGAIGSCVSMNKKTPYVADRKEGLGGTSEWKFCSLTPNSTTAFYFVVQNSPTVSQAQQVPCGYVQFITQYNGSDGFRHVRVTTVRRFFGSDDLEFDQESAAVLLARMACYRSETGEMTGQEILRWLDRSLVRICQKFGDYHPNSPESFRLRESFCMFPTFLFNLRRSQFLQVFNNSPDETTFYRHSLMREDCSNSLLMIQPSLVAYELHQETKPVSLDTSSIQPERILLMDSFFHMVIFHGERVAAWRKQEYQNKEGFEAFKALLEAPINDANELMMSRFPLPRYVVCDQHSSQARFLLSRVNPSVTHNNAIGYYGDPALAPVLSDDVSYAVFEEHLRKLTVSSTA